MQEKPTPANTKLLWNGRQTVDEVRRLLGSVQGPLVIELHLPADLHHSLFVTLHPEAGSEELQELAEEGGAELLRRIETLPGIEAMADIREVVAERGLKVRIESPSPRIVISS